MHTIRSNLQFENLQRLDAYNLKLSENLKPLDAERLKQFEILELWDAENEGGRTMPMLHTATLRQ